MKFYGRSRKNNAPFQEMLDSMESDIDLLTKKTKHLPTQNPKKLRNLLLSIEGGAASSYWKMVKTLLGENAGFPGRERRGARDLINSCLNYGYGILYGKVWRALILSGLNPYLGFLHEPQVNKPVLVFDLIEEFRAQVVDRAIFTMVTRDEKLELHKKTGLLAEDTRKKVIKNVLERLAALVPYHKGKIPLNEVIRHQAGRIARCLESGKSYRPFVGRY